jgi:hypothetical protein
MNVETTSEITRDVERTAIPPFAALTGYAPSFVYSTQAALWGESEVIGFGSDAFQVREMPRDKACEIVRANHYSKTIYSAAKIHLGVYAPEHLGVLQFGPAMNPASQAGIVAETKEDEYLELNRMWLDDALPHNSESRAISYALKYIKRRFPKIAWVQSFADERCGRFGVVYQACNFIYLGEHTSIFWELDGQVYHNSLMTDSRRAETPYGKRLREGKDRATCHKLRQFRYLYFIKRAFRPRLKMAVRPYPKHASEGSMESCPVTNGKGAGQFRHDAPISPGAKAHNK